MIKFDKKYSSGDFVLPYGQDFQIQATIYSEEKVTKIRWSLNPNITNTTKRIFKNVDLKK